MLNEYRIVYEYSNQKFSILYFYTSIFYFIIAYHNYDLDSYLYEIRVKSRYMLRNNLRNM